MKIIGRNEKGYIVTVSSEEMSKLLGFNSYVTQTKERPVSIGEEVEISKTWDQLSFVRENQTRLNKMADSLEDHAKKIRNTEVEITTQS